MFCRRFPMTAVVIILLGAFIAVGCASENPKTPIDAKAEPRLAKLTGKLSSKDARERTVAILALQVMGPGASSAVPYLIGMLDDDTPVSIQRNAIRTVTVTTSPGREAAVALSRIGEESVLPLIRSLRKDDSTTRENAAWALGTIRDPRAVEPLRELLWDNDAGVRQVSEWALQQILHRNRPQQPQRMIENGFTARSFA